MSDRDRPVRRGRPRFSILVKLLLAFTVPTMALFSGFAVFAHGVAREGLEAELGTRLSAVAAAASSRIRGKYVVDLVPGDEDELFYEGARKRLLEVMRETGVARIYIFDRDFVTRVDTEPNVPIGATQFQAKLDRLELRRVFDEGAVVSSVLFEGNDEVLYKAGYAPVYADPEDDREVLLALGVDAPADFFDRLSILERSLFLYGVLLALAVMAVAVVVAARITRPVRRLMGAAERIGRGDLDVPIKRMSRDEIGFLAETMEEMRRELQARDERMQLMLSGIAHEVRNPLGGMELFAGILREELPEGDERRGHVERIAREVGHLKQVVGDFLDYARRPEPELADLSLGALALDVCELETGRASAAGVKLTSRVEEVSCVGDGTQMRRVLLNLVQNGITAASAAGEGEVRVETGAAGARALLRVWNSGAPIPKEELEKIFEPFFTTREKGTGLGLAFAREIISDHGGNIEVESGDSGTTFTVELRRE